MSQLIHCIYASVATAKFDRPSMEALLMRSRERNVARGLTGMLLYTGDNFFQVLEGEETVVETLYETIHRDTRHTKVTKVIQEPIARRAFGSWTMGLAMLSRADLASLPGANDFFVGANCLTDISTGRATRLLRAFSEDNLWRATLSGARANRAKGRAFW